MRTIFGCVYLFALVAIGIFDLFLLLLFGLVGIGIERAAFAIMLGIW